MADALSPTAPRLREGARFAYEHDLNIPWRHEVRIEDHLPAGSGKVHPRGSGGQYFRSAAQHDEAEGARLLASLDRIKWLLWHGNQHLDRILR